MRVAFKGISLAVVALALSPAALVAADRPAIEAALQSAQEVELGGYYRLAGHRPIWLRGNAVRPEAERLVNLLRGAELDGFEEGPALADRVGAAVQRARSGDAKDLARAEVQLSSAWVRYVQALRRPANIGMTFIDPSLSPSRQSPVTVLEAAAAAPSLTGHMEGTARLNPLYAQLREGLASWRERWGGLPSVAVPAGAPLSIGDRGERVSLLRERLGLGGGSIFDGELAAKLRAFKEAHGLPATSTADAETIHALNQGPDAVERRLRLNLDRARALPVQQDGRYVLVDAASARLWLYEDGEAKDSMRVIVGKPTEQTPMLAGLIRTAVLNPYWNVPTDLVERKIAPNVLKDGVGYLKAKDYEVLSDWTEDAKPVDPRSVDWAAVAAGTKELRVRQLPGKLNSMGAVKFMFPNQFGVYLHDTPDKALFADANRSQSSGCVRVEDAARLARWLFGKAPKPTASGPEQAVALPTPVPVYINYFTAGWNGDQFALRPDVYGRDGPGPRLASSEVRAAR
jgi:murein L,D-transpeptidase YcbB/YkuD